MTPTNIYDQLCRDEGVVDHVYFLNGIPHLGVGHNGSTSGPRLSAVAIDMILHDDVAALEEQCQHLAGWNRLDDARQGVLLNLGYRIGFGGLTGFVHMLQAVALGDWTAAAWEIRNSKLATESDPQRTERLAVQMTTGAWQ